MLHYVLEKTRRDTIRNSQIQEALNQEPVTKMVYRWELRWFGHLIKMHNSGKRKEVWNRGDEETRGRGMPRVKREHLMGKLTGEKKDLPGND
jgi:hypothetical protein